MHTSVVALLVVMLVSIIVEVDGFGVSCPCSFFRAPHALGRAPDAHGSIMRENVLGGRLRMQASLPRGHAQHTGPLCATRRQVLLAAAALVVLHPQQTGAEQQGPIVVLGAGGGTGRECVLACQRRGLPVTAVVRDDYNSKGERFSFATFPGRDVDVVQGDVTKPDQLPSLLKGSSAVIFAASASKKGGNPAAVDYKAVVDTAKVCIELQIPRLVIVSSGGVSKPTSSIYLLLNLFGKIMEYKFKGEEEVRALYKNAPVNLGYTIVRPGGLLADIPPAPVSSIELSQGDSTSGRIPRADVAEICIEAIKSPAASRTTFECYSRDTAKPLNDVGLSNIFKRKTSESEKKSLRTGRECTADTWDALFSQLEKDA